MYRQLRIKVAHHPQLNIRCLLEKFGHGVELIVSLESVKSISIPSSIVPDIDGYEVGDEVCVRLEGEITAKADGDVTLKLSDTSIEEPGSYDHTEEEEGPEAKDKRALVIGIVGKPRE
jgi:hypothetical protein